VRRLLFLLVVATFSVVRAEIPKHAFSLYSGKDLSGWEYVSPGEETLSMVCHVKPEGVLAIDGKPNGYIATLANYENYVLHVEWRWTAKPGNSGVLVHITKGPTDRIWPISFQVQTKNTRVGDLLSMSLAKFAESPTPEITPGQLARVGPDAEKPIGEWNHYDIVCRGDTIEVTVNGVAQNRVTKCIPASGKIGFQLEGAPYELRNIQIGPLKPAIGASYQDGGYR